MDLNQISPPDCKRVSNVEVGGSYKSVMLISFQGRAEKKHESDSLAAIFKQASTMVQESFAEKEIDIDLFGHHSGPPFTADVLVDPSTGEVIAAAEYVFMRKYLWVECLAIKKSYRRSGIGKLLMSRYMNDNF